MIPAPLINNLSKKLVVLKYDKNSHQSVPFRAAQLQGLAIPCNCAGATYILNPNDSGYCIGF